MNTVAYIIYLLITGFITVYVGRRCFFHGRLYLEAALDQDLNLANKINRLLLTGYYLLNLGYAVLMITMWENVLTYTQLFSSIAMMSGRIILTLGLMHYLNLFVILWWHHTTHTTHTTHNHKTIQS